MSSLLCATKAQADGQATIMYTMKKVPNSSEVDAAPWNNLRDWMDENPPILDFAFVDNNKDVHDMTTLYLHLQLAAEPDEYCCWSITLDKIVADVIDSFLPTSPELPALARELRRLADELERSADA